MTDEVQTQFNAEEIVNLLLPLAGDSEVIDPKHLLIWIGIGLLSVLDRVLHVNIRGRDRDRAVQRSPALEGLHQLAGAFVAGSLQAKLQANGIEQRDIGTHRLRTVHCSLDLDGNGLQRNA